MDEKEKPLFRYGHVEIRAKPIAIRTTIQLEAVGQDWDGTVKPLDDLKYPPKAEGGE